MYLEKVEREKKVFFLKNAQVETLLENDEREKSWHTYTGIRRTAAVPRGRSRLPSSKTCMQRQPKRDLPAPAGASILITRECFPPVEPKEPAIFSGVPCSRASISLAKCKLEVSAPAVEVVEFGAHSEGGCRLYCNGTYTSSCLCTSKLAASMASCSLHRWLKKTSAGVEELGALLQRKKSSNTPTKEKIIIIKNS